MPGMLARLHDRSKHWPHKLRKLMATAPAVGALTLLAAGVGGVDPLKIIWS